MRRGQSGTWWIVNLSYPGEPPVYWTADVRGQGHHGLSFDHRQAAQFDTPEQAHFNARLLGLADALPHYRVEHHAWIDGV
jgi:hypothetical protein